MDRIENILWQTKYLKDKNWLKVKNLLQQAISEYPEDSRLHFELAELYYSKKLFVKAINTYQQIIYLDGENDEINFRIGNCFLALKEFLLAIDYYEKVEDFFPELYYNKAYTYSKLGKVETSIGIMEDLLVNQTNSEIPYIFLAELLFNQKEYNRALEYLEEAESLFGKQSSIFYLKGIAYFHLENWLKSYLEFKQAENLKLESYHFYRAYGLTCEKIGKTEEGIRNLLRSIKLDPLSATSYLELIRIYLDHDRVMEAYSIMQHARRNIPFSISLSLLYNQILQRIDGKRINHPHD